MITPTQSSAVICSAYCDAAVPSTDSAVSHGDRGCQAAFIVRTRVRDCEISAQRTITSGSRAEAKVKIVEQAVGVELRRDPDATLH
jgi:hypothetical protein